jgi:hypothetical protein
VGLRGGAPVPRTLLHQVVLPFRGTTLCNPKSLPAVYHPLQRLRSGR